MINFSLKTFKLIISSLLCSFSNRYLFVIIILSFETFFHLFYFINKSENFIGKKTSLSLIPLHSMVLMSVIGSSAFGVVKKRFQEVNKKKKQIKTEFVGMPPAYITVDSSFDDHPLVEDEEQLLIIYSNVTRKSYPSRALYKSLLKGKNLKTMMISGTAIDFLTDLINHDTFQKLSVIKNNNSKMKNQNALNEISNLDESSTEHCLDPLAKDNKGTWYLEFAGTLQFLLTGSFMTVILIANKCDLYIFLINSIDRGTGKQITRVVDS